MVAVSEEFMEEMVKKIIVYGAEQVEVVWRYRDEFEIDTTIPQCEWYIKHML